MSLNTTHRSGPEDLQNKADPLGSSPGSREVSLGNLTQTSPSWCPVCPSGAAEEETAYQRGLPSLGHENGEDSSGLPAQRRGAQSTKGH